MFLIIRLLIIIAGWMYAVVSDQTISRKRFHPFGRKTMLFFFINVCLMYCWPEGFMNCCLTIVSPFYMRGNFLSGFLLPGVSWCNLFYLPAYKTAISWTMWPLFLIVKVLMICCFVALTFHHSMHFLKSKSGIFVQFWPTTTFKK